jgi:hypothetical protein
VAQHRHAEDCIVSIRKLDASGRRDLESNIDIWRDA